MTIYTLLNFEHPIILTWIIFVLLIVACVTLSQRRFDLAMHIKNALSAGLAGVLASDFIFGTNVASILVTSFNYILRVENDEESGSFEAIIRRSDTEILNMICYWLIFSFVCYIIAAFYSGRWKRGIFHYGVLPLPPKTEQSKPSSQRTFSYPDTLEFNFFDPDDLPFALQVNKTLSSLGSTSYSFCFSVLCSVLDIYAPAH